MLAEGTWSVLLSTWPGLEPQTPRSLNFLYGNMTFCKISKDISWLLFNSIQKLVILRKCLDLYWFSQICNSLLKGLKYIKIIKWIIKMSNKHCTLRLLSGSTSCSWIPVPADSYCPFPLVVLNLIISKDSHSVFMNTSTGADSIRSFNLYLTTQLCSVFLKTFFTPTF